MTEPEIVGFTVKQLANDPDRLNAFDDPGNYLKESGLRWGEFLAANPKGDEDDVAIVLTVVGGKVVGTLRSIAIELQISNEVYRSTALRAFFLDDKWRKSGAGGMMLLRVLSSSRSAIASGGPSIDATTLYQGVGFQELGPLSRFIYFNSTRALIHTVTKGLPGASAIAQVANPVARSYYRFRAPASKSTLRFRAISQFSKGLDTLLLARNDDHTVRLTADLNWVLKYSKSITAYEISDGNNLVGYCLIHSENRKATSFPRRLPAMLVVSLLDYYIKDRSAANLRQLVSFAISGSRELSADVLEIQSNKNDVIACLKQFGFVRAGGSKVLLRPPRGTALDRDRWLLTQAEGDVIFSGLTGMRNSVPIGAE